MVRYNSLLCRSTALSCLQGQTGIYCEMVCCRRERGLQTLLGSHEVVLLSVSPELWLCTQRQTRRTHSESKRWQTCRANSHKSSALANNIVRKFQDAHSYVPNDSYSQSGRAADKQLVYRSPTPLALLELLVLASCSTTVLLLLRYSKTLLQHVEGEK